ncbi:NAD(P)/FAD-dependent oxidoreductase [Sphingosinicella sp. BN140058]|uniref:NAD(P)/FAD-dependent oxidoreductase n=1 Tax=Sphingosinicella sp. BN140058 TaxID=1892855 RepID=UPI001010E77E|nr:NAD(P)/FAD-dependent oxidoreductase [Sphingosinicella sp. BN140058]QAY78660.1 NAD(P)/FAD-dependent oxidoreductase [Sphingosinicella sp. BN140058]
MSEEPCYDCLVIGGGPAGLTAAIYLTRFHLSLKVVDAGNSRAGWIPCTHNHAGYPEGISGKELVARMKEQAQKYGASVVSGRVTRIDRIEGGFRAEWGEGSVITRTILLATGVTNRKPPMDEELHDEALQRGLIRYCPICDGYEVTDKKLGVIGSGSHGVAEAVFLRGFTEDVTLIAPDMAHCLSEEDQARLAEFDIVTVDGPCQAVAAHDDCIVVDTAEGHYTFDSVYPALGSDTHVELALQLGAALHEGVLVVDSHQRTSVPGLYAAGDVVLGLDQISHAMGEGGVAATTIRNDMAKVRPIKRETLKAS